jgi:hypothetical protein
VLGLNQYGIWFGSFEELTLNINDNSNFADSVSILETRHIDDLTINTYDGGDEIFLAATNLGATEINLGDGADEINIASVAGPTVINAGLDNDIMRVNYTSNGYQTFLNGISGILTLHGEAGSDQYEVGLSGLGSSTINIDDDSPVADPGADALRIYGTNDTDFFLFRPSSISSLEVDNDRNLVENGAVERVNYNADINAGVTVYGRDGDDFFVFDDTSSILTVFGDAGNDTFQVGQMFKSPRGSNSGLPVQDQFQTTLTTQGYLSNGISFPATLYGGIGEDNFIVYHNRADLFLFGEEDDDSFVVRAFVRVDPEDPKAPITNVNGGQGADFISYTVNSPVNIEGGDGFDTLTVIGTEFGDDFVVTEDGVYGAGLFVSYGGIEKDWWSWQ